MRSAVCVLLGLVGLCVALPPLALQDINKPDPPVVTSDGVIVEEVVNTHKRAIILVTSSATPEGEENRALARDTWMQPLNRTSMFAMEQEERRQVSVWFVVERDGDMSRVEEEGKLNGDMLIINKAEHVEKSDRLDVVGGLLRWVRVAYFERYDYVILINDDGFISLYNLPEFLESNKDNKMFYGGSVASFDKAPASYGHKYYSAFARDGTIVLSYAASEFLARELSLLKHFESFGASIGQVMMSIDNRPVSSSQIIGDMKNVYSAVDAPVLIKHLTKAQMVLFSTPVLVNGKWVTPSLPAQTAEVSTRRVYVDPHPTEVEPECDLLAANSPCSMESLKRNN